MPEVRAGEQRESALRRAGLALYRVLWGTMFVAALVAPVLAAIELARLAGPPADSAATAALPFRVEAWLLYSLNLIPAAFLTAAAVLLFWRRGREPVAMILSFSFLSSAASMPFIEPWLAPSRFEYLRHVVELSAPMTGILGMLLFPNGRFVPRWMAVPALALVPWTLWRILDQPPLLIDAPLNDAFGLLVIASVLIRYHRLAPGSPQRLQIRWAVLGIAVGLALNNLALALFTLMTELPLGEAARAWMLIAARTLLIGFYVAMPGGLLISLLRYRLYDADAVITRSAALAATTLLLAAIFAGSSEGIKWLIESGLGQDAGLIPGVVAAALTTVLVTPAHDRLRAWSAARFQHALQHMRRDLPLVVGDRRETARLAELLDEVLTRIAAGTRAQRSVVVLRKRKAFAPALAHGAGQGEVEGWLGRRLPVDHGQRLDCDREDPLFPLRIPLRADDTLIGWMLLGPRPDDSFYGRDEREALAAIAGPIARAIRVVQLREAYEQHQERRIAALERKLAELAGPASKRSDGGSQRAVRSSPNGRSKRGGSPAAARG
jgi:hypothetical protein